MVPRVISGKPNLADLLARMMSHIRASSQPPPRANPLTAAMTGNLHWDSYSQWPKRLSFIHVLYSLSFISFMSAPAAKAFSPSPVIIIHFISLLSSHHFIWLFNYKNSSSHKAFSCLGRFSRTTPIFLLWISNFIKLLLL